MREENDAENKKDGAAVPIFETNRSGSGYVLE